MRSVSSVLSVRKLDPIQHYAESNSPPLSIALFHSSRACRSCHHEHTSLTNVLCFVFLVKIATRTSEHLAQVASVYRQFYGRDLVDVLKKETSGHFGRALHYLILPPLLLDAELVHDAIVGAGTNERVSLFLEGR